jgi:hypothetical protein
MITSHIPKRLPVQQEENMSSFILLAGHQQELQALSMPNRENSRSVLPQKAITVEAVLSRQPLLLDPPSPTSPKRLSVTITSSAISL